MNAVLYVSAKIYAEEGRKTGSKNKNEASLIERMWPVLFQKAILDLLYEFFGIPLPAWTDEVSVALSAVDPSHPQESWKLSDSFIAAEGRSILPHLSSHRCVSVLANQPQLRMSFIVTLLLLSSRPNIVVQHLAVLLYSFLEAGLLGALVEVIVDEDTFLSVRSTILLGKFYTIYF